MGATAMTILRTDVTGNTRYHSGTGTLSASYAAGGDTFTARNLGLTSVDQMQVTQADGFTLEVDVVNSTILAYEDKVTAAATPLLEQAAASDMSAVAFRWQAWGA